MSDLTPGPAVDCTGGCGVMPVRKEDQAAETCPVCEQYALPVQVEACPDPETCQDDAHDFGNGMHVLEMT